MLQVSKSAAVTVPVVATKHGLADLGDASQARFEFEAVRLAGPLVG